MIYDLTARLNQGGLKAEIPSRDGIDGWDLDNVLEFFPPGDLTNATFTAHQYVELPDFAQEYLSELEVENCIHLKEIRAAMTMLAHCLQSNREYVFVCAITPCLGSFEYYFSWGGNESLVSFSGDESWGIRGREVAGKWCALFQEKFGTARVTLTTEVA